MQNSCNFLANYYKEQKTHLQRYLYYLDMQKSYYECDSSKDNKSIEFMFHDVKKNQLCCHKKFSFLIYLFLSELLPSCVVFVLPKYTIKIASDVVEQ